MIFLNAQNGPERNSKLDFVSNMVGSYYFSKILRNISINVQAKGNLLQNCKPGLPRFDEGNLHVVFCVCWWLRKWHKMAALASPPLQLRYCTYSCVYFQCIQRSPVLKRNQSLSSVHRSWSKIRQVGHEVPVCCLYRFSHCEISGGIQNLVALVCSCLVSFNLLFFFLTVYYCGSDVFTKMAQPFIIMVSVLFFYFFSRRGYRMLMALR